VNNNDIISGATEIKLRQSNTRCHDGVCRQVLLEEVCPLCLCSPNDELYIRNSFCGHLTCNSCLIGLMKTKTYRFFPLKCPSPMCSTIFPLADIDEFLTRGFDSEQEFTNFLRLVLENLFHYFIRLNKLGYRECKTPDCATILKAPFRKNTGQSTTESSLHGVVQIPAAVGTEIRCNGCLTSRCSECGNPFHEGQTCFQYFLEHCLPISLKRWKEEQPIARRFCPTENCFVPIEKADGCNHIKCEECGTEFCWNCEDFRALTSREIYEHLRHVHGDIGIVEFGVDDWG